MTTIDIEDSTRRPNVPPTPSSSRPTERARRWWIVPVAAALLAGFLIGSAFVPVPYVTLRPGSARPVTEQILVDGHPSYPPEQSIAYTTVSIGQSTLFEAVVGWLDDDVDVVPEERIRGDRSPEESRRYNAQLMDTSKLAATTVALRQLGQEVTITTTGAVVRRMVEGSPAAGALQLDDVIVAVDGQPVDELGEVGDLLQPGGPGAEHVLTVERPAGSTTHVDVPIATIADTDDPTRALIGIYPEDRISDVELPIAVTIDSGNVGGPSAGLAFALAVIDVLTPGELTGGHRVAVTGTIALDGTVGPVGGAAQKAVTVRDAGYEVFLVPSAEETAVREAVGADLEVIGVDTLAQALDALGSLGGIVGAIAETGAGPSS